MKHEQLDEEGLASSYLMLTAALPFAIYFLYIYFPSKKNTTCQCENCQRFSVPKKKHEISFYLFQSVFWIFFSYLLKNVLTIQIKQKFNFFNPYEILKVTAESTQNEIKKAFRNLIKKTMKQSKGTDADDILRDINRAYESLKNSENKLLIEPDESKPVFAVSAGIIKFQPLILIFYIVFLGGLIPYYFYKRNRVMKQTSDTGSLYKSNELFYRSLNSFSNIFQLAIQGVLLVISQSEEFKTHKWNWNIEELDMERLKVILENQFACPLISKEKEYFYVIAYLTRNLRDQEDSTFVKDASLKLIQSFIRIASIAQNDKLFENLLIMQKMFNQAVFLPQYYGVQYPGVSYKLWTNEKISKETVMGKPISISINDDLSFLKMHVQDPELAISKKLLDDIPRIDIKAIDVYCNDSADKNIGNNTYLVSKNNLVTVEIELACNSKVQKIHTPFSYISTNNQWILYQKLGNSILESVIYIDFFTGNKKIKINLPEIKTKEELKIFVVSNGYFGNDISKVIFLKVQ